MIVHRLSVHAESGQGKAVPICGDDSENVLILPRSIHVAFYSPGWPIDEFQNGIVTYVKHMRKALLSLGHKVTVVTARIGESNKDSDIIEVIPDVVTKLKMKARQRLGILTIDEFSAPIADTFRKLHRRSPIDVIEMEESFGWVKALHQLDIPVVVKLHGPAFLTFLKEAENDPSAKNRIAKEGLALGKFQFITAPSVRTALEVKKYYGLTSNIIHARNPIDPNVMQQWCAKSASPDTALFVGRFDNLKGADLVLNAFKIVLSRMPLARLIFVGPDRGIRDEEGSLIKFDAYAQRLFTSAELSRIIYVGPQAPKAIEQLRTTARLTIVASRWETAGYTATEALAQGCPVVAMKCAGIDEVVFHEHTGLISTTVGGLADNILALFGSKEKAARLGGAGKSFIAETHSPAIAMKAALNVYRRAISRAVADHGG